MSKYMRAIHGAAIYPNCKTSDLAYSYSGERVVTFDFVRSTQAVLNYAVIESIKNGTLFSPKYESCTKNFDIPHVIVFSNFEPDLEKLSRDRWDIIRMEKNIIKRKHEEIFGIQSNDTECHPSSKASLDSE